MQLTPSLTACGRTPATRGSRPKRGRQRIAPAPDGASAYPCLRGSSTHAPQPSQSPSHPRRTGLRSLSTESLHGRTGLSIRLALFGEIFEHGVGEQLRVFDVHAVTGWDHLHPARRCRPRNLVLETHGGLV